MIMIYNSSDFQEVTIATIILLFGYYYFPKILLAKFLNYWYVLYIIIFNYRKNYQIIYLRNRRRKFPPKRKLLTVDEFNEQGSIETKKALEQLKLYCSSPDSKPWKTVSRLKNPKR